MLDKIPDVVIDEDGDHKFIVAIIADPNGERKRVVRGDKRARMHRTLLRALCEELKDIAPVKILRVGGGYINVQADRKIIGIDRKSVDFGQEPDREETARVLQEAYPNYVVHVA